MIVAKDIKRTLINTGYQITSIASSGKEAIRKAKTDNPDLILMDIVLPGKMNGIETAEQIHGSSNIPIVYLTAHADDATLKRARITKPYGYITKPFSDRQLHSVIEIAIHKIKIDKKNAHLSSVLRAIRDVNQLIIKEKNRGKLLKGVCKKLTKSFGYLNTWIVAMDKSGKPSVYAQAGIDKGFASVVAFVKRGKPPKCWKKVLSKSGVVVIQAESTICAGCPLSYKNSERRILGARLESNKQVYGLITTSTLDNSPIAEDELSLFKEVADDVGLALHSITMEEERKQALRRLEESEARLRNIIRKNADGIIIVDENGIVRFVNPAAKHLFNRKANEILGAPFGFPVVAGEATEINIIRQNREKIVAEMRIVDIEWQDKSAHLASLRDITARRQTEKALEQSLEKSQRILQQTVKSLSSALEKRDPYTAGHSWRVAQLACAIAKELHMTDEQITGIHMAAAIHDIGKIYVPSDILSKPSKLNEFEFGMVKSHCQIGYEILENIEFPWPVAKTVLQHHERINGSGYPQGLKGRRLLREARILGVADVVEAMCSIRPYRPAPGIDKALDEITNNKNILYDPQIVDACLRLFKEKGFKFE